MRKLSTSSFPWHCLVLSEGSPGGQLAALVEVHECFLMRCGSVSMRSAVDSAGLEFLKISRSLDQRAFPVLGFVEVSK